MNTVFQRCVNYALKKVCFHNTPWCVNLHTPKTHLIMCYFKDKRCVWRTHHGVFWEHTCFYSVHKKVAAGIGLLRRIRDFTSLDILIKIYKSLIQPHFEYASAVWDNLDVTL